MNHKYFNIYERNNYSKNADKNELNFWLKVWINYYSYVTEIYDPAQNLFLIHYDDLAKEPNELKKAIEIKIKKKLNTDLVNPYKNNKALNKNSIEVNDKQLLKAEEIYRQLLLNKIKIKEYNNI